SPIGGAAPSPVPNAHSASLKQIPLCRKAQAQPRMAAGCLRIVRPLQDPASLEPQRQTSPGNQAVSMRASQSRGDRTRPNVPMSPLQRVDSESPGFESEVPAQPPDAASRPKITAPVPRLFS